MASHCFGAGAALTLGVSGRRRPHLAVCGPNRADRGRLRGPSSGQLWRLGPNRPTCGSLRPASATLGSESTCVGPTPAGCDPNSSIVRQSWPVIWTGCRPKSGAGVELTSTKAWPIEREREEIPELRRLCTGIGQHGSMSSTCGLRAKSVQSRCIGHLRRRNDRHSGTHASRYHASTEFGPNSTNVPPNGQTFHRNRSCSGPVSGGPGPMSTKVGTTSSELGQGHGADLIDAKFGGP